MEDHNGMNDKQEGTEMDLSSRDEKDQLAVIAQIVRSRFFVGATQRIDLLHYLFDNRARRLTEADIAVEHFGLLHVEEIDGGKVRKLCGALRSSLTGYAESDVAKGHWRIFLPRALRDGYQLRLVNLNRTIEADHKFWRSHLEPSRPIAIVYDEPLFYRDETDGTVIRMPQVELGGEPSATSEPPEVMRRLLRSDISPKLHPCHLYTLSGETGARDHIADWFDDGYGIKAEVKISRLMRDISELSGHSAIVLGNVRTSKILREITSLHQFGRFGYFVDSKSFRTVEVRGCTKAEKAILSERLR